MNGFVHEPVMLGEILAVFREMAGGTFVDATLGGAGHAAAILAAHANVTLIGIDQDDTALAAAAERLRESGLGGRVALRRARFESVGQVVEGEGIDTVVGALFDLGVSSPQLDVAERGFSYRHDAPLDMRMDRRLPSTAADLLAELPEKELADLIWRYGEEPASRRIARQVVRRRTNDPDAKDGPVRTTRQLSDAVRAAGVRGKFGFECLRFFAEDVLTGADGAQRGFLDLIVDETFR